MHPLIRFIYSSAKNQPIPTIGTIVMMAIGLNLQDIAIGVLNDPPRWLIYWSAQWWVPWVTFALSAWLLAYIFWRQSETDREKKLSPDIGAAEVFNKIIEQSKWSKNTIKTIDVSRYCYPPKFDESQKLERAVSYKLANELHDHLRQGTVSAWGKFNKNDGDNTPERLIEPDEWDDIRLSFDRRSLTSVPEVSCAYSEIDRLPILHYFQVRLCEQQVCKLYPLAWRKRKISFVSGTAEIAFKKV